VAFITSALGADVAPLLADPASRDAVLESDRLLHCLLHARAPLPVSPRLYFYVITRRVLAHHERVVADYIATVLAEFLEGDRWQTLPGLPDMQTRYVTDMLTVLADLKGDRAFLLQAHIGNFSLFVSGIFPEHIRHRATRRGAPALDFYESVGSTHYRLAAHQPQARTTGLENVLETIGNEFSDVRRGLNRVADQFLHWNVAA
jgi:hypothetical protein